MGLLKLLLVLLTCSAAVPAVAGPFEDGVAAYRRGDYATALRLYRPLADGGSASAQYNIGIMYDKGQGVPQDYAEAISWYRKAADQGHSTAQNNLGAMYNDGTGVPQDYVLAYMWFNLAASGLKAPESDIAVKNRDRVATRMTAAQIAESQKLAREWKPKAEQ
jgi:TPR repeat protein